MALKIVFLDWKEKDMKVSDFVKTSIFSKIKGFFNDSVWSIAALMLMNVVSQFIIYPLWSKKFNNEVYGNIVYIMSLINIFAVSFGIATNYSRMAESAKRKTHNGDYNIVLSVGSIISGIFTFAIVLWGNVKVSVLEAILIALLCAITMWRYYADVEYRLNLDYKGYFLYYAVISIGYLVGGVIFWLTDIWPFALLVGELGGLFYIYKKGTILSDKPFIVSKYFNTNIKAIIILIITNLLSNVIFNGDRLLLQFFLSGTAVTIYYLASLVGKTMSLVTTPLNSVIIGYLASYKGNFTFQMMHIFLGGSIIAIFIGTLVGVIGSHILIFILYPQNYDIVKNFFLIANITQVIYFVTNVITTILLRLANTKYQLVINTTYAITFLIMCIPATYLYGFNAFCIALFIVNIIRYVLALFLCYYNIKIKNEWRKK